MNKSIAVVSILALLVLVLGGIYLGTRPTEDTVEQDSPSAQIDFDGSQTVNASLLSLAQGDRNAKCEFSHVDGEENYTGTVFVSGERMRGLLIGQTGTDQEVNATYISDGQWYYVWGTAPEGEYAVKMQIDFADKFSSDETDTEVSFDATQDMEFNCTAWDVDESRFVPPATVEFVDISSQLGAAVDQSGTDQVGLPCTACDSLEGEQKEMCMRVANCE